MIGIVAGTGLLVATAMMTSAMAGAPASGPGSGGCQVTARIDAQWGTGATGGQILTVTVTNTAATTATKWTVGWTLGAGQRVVSGWNAIVSTAGTTLTAVNAVHNGVLAPAASTTFGMQLSGLAPAPALNCGNDTSTPPTTATPPSGDDVTVTQADNQRTVTLLVGQTLGVALGPDFVTPMVSGPALARLSTSGGYPTGQPLAASYRAVAVGSVDITSHTDYACLHTSPPCALPTTLWTLHVNVVDVPDTGRTVTVSTADNLSTVSLRVGDTVVVRLPSAYLPPRITTGGVIVQRDVAGGYPTGQPLLARYLAATPGQTDVSTQTDDPCNHLPTPCPSPTVRWSAHIIVTTA